MTEHTQQTARISIEMSDTLMSPADLEAMSLSTVGHLKSSALWHWHCSFENDVGVANADLNALERISTTEIVGRDVEERKRLL
jgi:hypothetical protein